MKNDYYQLEEQFQKELEVKLRDLLEFCQIHQLPMFATVAIENTETDTIYNNITYGPSSHNMRLTKNQINDHILISSNSFHAVPAREDPTIDLTHFV